MAQRIWIAGSIIAMAIGAAAHAVNVAAIAPGGPGVLTKCRNWLVATSCRTYHHVSLPPRIAVGDSIPITFGSSRKQYAFPVARIALTDHSCTIYSEANGNQHRIDRIEIAQCQPAEADAVR